jgi:heptosyltransferase II
LKSILVIQTASIGDVILSTPVVEILHAKFPEANIDLLVKKGMAGLFNGHPFLNEVITWDKSHHKITGLIRILRKVRKTRYDAVINIQRFALTGILTSFSGAKIRIGFSKNPFSFFFTKKIDHEIRQGIHETNRNLRLIESLAGEGSSKPHLYPSTADYQAVLSYKHNGQHITISPASLWFTKQFPAEKWIEFIHRINASVQILLLGSKEDIPLCEELKKKSGRESVTNLAGKLSFLESAALMKDAVMNFTNDSAPMHLASAVNAPVTVIYCSTVPSFGFGPLSENSSVIETEVKLDCRPCGLHGFKVCPKQHFLCAATIDTDRLAARVHS